VLSAPEILVQPTNQSLEINLTATFSVTAVGQEPLSYQWQWNGTNLVDGADLVHGGDFSGTTTNVLTISGAQITNNGIYSVTIMNSSGAVTSSNAVLTVTNVLEITEQPASQTVGVGSDVTFNVDGFATHPYFLQWQKDGTNLVDGGRILGATSVPLTVSNAQLSDTGNYQFIITNNWGSVTSSVAVLTVLSSPLFGGIAPATGTNGGFILSGFGGTNGGTYYVLTSSNLVVPLTNWDSIATNQFDSSGNFIFTNAAQTNTPQLFYILKY
jgi:hypothetical protein